MVFQDLSEACYNVGTCQWLMSAYQHYNKASIVIHEHQKIKILIHNFKNSAQGCDQITFHVYRVWNKKTSFTFHLQYTKSYFGNCYWTASFTNSNQSGRTCLQQQNLPIFILFYFIITHPKKQITILDLLFFQLID
jgi:hypothetical protein